MDQSYVQFALDEEAKGSAFCTFSGSRPTAGINVIEKDQLQLPTGSPTSFGTLETHQKELERMMAS